MKVLLVEDHTLVRRGLAQLLVTCVKGAEVTEAADADQAAEILKHTAHDVALVDVRLGPYSGLDLLSELAERRPGILTVVMTAHGVVDTAVQALRIGAYDYLSKPFDQTELFATIDRCFERVELQRARIDAEAARGNGHRHGGQGRTFGPSRQQDLLLLAVASDPTGHGSRGGA